jgi:hypothetical protein
MRLDKDKEIWQTALKTAEEQHQACKVRLDALDVERSELVQEMQRLERAMDSIRPFTSDHPLDDLNKFVEEFSPDPDSGLADACRNVLAAAQRFMMPIEIRDILEASNYDLTQHSNPLASIHGILKRFDESGEVTMVLIGNKASYRIAARQPQTSLSKLKTPRWRTTVPTKEEAAESERRRAEARAAMEKAKSGYRGVSGVPRFEDVQAEGGVPTPPSRRLKFPSPEKKKD